MTDQMSILQRNDQKKGISAPRINSGIIMVKSSPALNAINDDEEDTGVYVHVFLNNCKISDEFHQLFSLKIFLF